MLVKSVEDAAGRLHDLTIARLAKLRWITTALRMVCQLLDMRKDPQDKRSRCSRIFQCNVVSDCIKIRKRWICPDYFNHLASRVLACAWVEMRPSAMACSPRAMPSRIAMRCCIS